MTEHDILDAIGDIDPAYLEEAKSKPVINGRKLAWMCSLAACLIIVFMVPFVYQHYWISYDSLDYAPEAYTKCDIYYWKDHAIYYESANVRGGDWEMFEIWKSKNNISDEAVLQKIVLSPDQNIADSDRVHHCDTVSVTLPASLKRYFENEDGAWRKESLKRTISSYRNITIDTLELLFI